MDATQAPLCGTLSPAYRQNPHKLGKYPGIQKVVRNFGDAAFNITAYPNGNCNCSPQDDGAHHDFCPAMLCTVLVPEGSGFAWIPIDGVLIQ